MKLVCAPDSFKGSLSAVEVADAMGAGALRADAKCTVVRVPLADGGEGTVESLVAARGGERRSVTAHDALGRPVTAEVGLLRDETIVIEMSSASGLPLLRPEERDPYRATTFGTGELIRAALDLGAREIILGVGGSATVDGGAGALQALGADLLDERGNAIEAGNRGLASLEMIDLTHLDSRLDGVTLRIASDVVNPLTGPTGAAAVFGPQKGAGRADIQVLDRNLERFAAVVSRCLGLEIGGRTGAGAAGGLTAGLLAVGARTEPGIELVLDATRFDQQLEGTDLVITGEGQIDGQTARGKVISGVLAHAARVHVPVIALAGSVRWAELGALYKAGLVVAFAVADGPMSYAKAVARTGPLVRHAAESVVRLWLSASHSR